MIKILINNNEIKAFSKLSITASLKQASRVFAMEFNGLFKQAKPQDEVKIFYNDELLLTGFIDSIPTTYDSTSVKHTINGRSRTSLLIDSCSNILNFENLTANEIIKAICKPFNIDFIDDEKTGFKVQKYKIEPNAKCYEAIQRLCEERGLFITDNADGNLTIFNTELTSSFNIELGVNVLKASTTNNWQNRYKTYTAYGGTTGDENNTSQNFKQSINDDSVKLNKYLTLSIPNATNSSSLKELVKRERDIRQSQSKSITYTLNGWYWRVGDYVNVVDEISEINETLLITSITYNFEGDYTCVITVEKDFAYLPIKKRDNLAKTGKSTAKDSGYNIITLDENAYEKRQKEYNKNR